MYTSNVGYDTVILDVDFETEEDRDKFYDGLDWGQREMAEVTAKIDDLRGSGMTFEILTLR